MAGNTGGQDGKAIRAARDRVEELRPLLLEASPAALDRCSQILEAALLAARAVSREAGGGPEKRRLAEEAALLRASLSRAARLLQSAAGYHAGWNRLLGAMSAGYTASGAPALPGRGGRLSVHG